MKDLHDLENLTIKEMLVAYLGEEKANVLLKAIWQGISDGLTGDKLNSLIFDTLCKFSFPDNVTIYGNRLHVIKRFFGNPNNCFRE